MLHAFQKKEQKTSQKDLELKRDIGKLLRNLDKNIAPYGEYVMKAQKFNNIWDALENTAAEESIMKAKSELMIALCAAAHTFLSCVAYIRDHTAH